MKHTRAAAVGLVAIVLAAASQGCALLGPSPMDARLRSIYETVPPSSSVRVDKTTPFGFKDTYEVTVDGVTYALTHYSGKSATNPRQPWQVSDSAILAVGGKRTFTDNYSDGNPDKIDPPSPDGKKEYHAALDTIKKATISSQNTGR